MDEKLLGKCGYYCGQCPDFLAGSCEGCVEGNRNGICHARDCVMEKGILSCGYCREFPCERILNDPKASLLSPLWLRWKADQRDK
ncbi:MAG: DUF3795 domain-containing protein [Solobacterium sp.]|nr:DUF3795 domain-containing protein [Solobacterium sp.]